ncbi:MAG: lipopolysaccharide biosynthesis protein [Bacteroidales bacterium]|nr:lipopolysaccharide biosynthesis protein [Bacteroidales bacterium]
MAESLKNKAFSGMVWVGLEKFALQIFAFIQGVIMARLLMPSDYGLVAMTGVFFSISYTFIDSGFSNALIRKKDLIPVDYSTVYVTNVILSLFFAILLCLCSSLIANFYKEPILQQIVCVDALSLFLGSFLAVQGVRLQVNLNFKVLSIITVAENVIGGIASIVLAFLGFGVWSLVYPAFVKIVVKAVLFWYYQRWFPGIRFSKQSFKELFAYGSKLLISRLIDSIYNNIYPLVIGKKFSSKDLGFYTKATGYANLPAMTVSDVLGRVTFPVLAKLQDDEPTLQRVYRRMIRLSAYVLFPIMVGVSVLAYPLIVLLIGIKWEPSVIYLQILCFVLMWYPIHALNLNLLQVKGRSDLFLRLEIIKKIVGVIILVITVPMGLIAMCVGGIFSSIICLAINTYYTGKLINVGFFKQMKDLLPTLIYSLSMGVVIYWSVYFISSLWLKLIIGLIVGVVFYFGLSKLTKSQDLVYLKELLQENILSRWKKQ